VTIYLKTAELCWGSRKYPNLAQIPLKMREKGAEAALLRFKALTSDIFGKKQVGTCNPVRLT
jgi:hypothetical protein